jgi:hypothetical protein
VPGLAAALFSAAGDEAARTRREGGQRCQKSTTLRAADEASRPEGRRIGGFYRLPEGRGCICRTHHQIPGLDVVFAAALTHNASTSAALVLCRAVEQSLATVRASPTRFATADVSR